MQHLALTYFYLQDHTEAISITEKCLALLGNVNDPNIKSNVLYNFIFLHNRTNQFDKSDKLLIELKLLKDKNINNNILIEYYVAKMDYYYSQKIIDLKLYEKLLKLILDANNKVNDAIFETAILQLISIDTKTKNFTVFDTFKNDKLFYNKLDKISNFSIKYHLKLVEMQTLNLNKRKHLQERIKLDIESTCNKNMKKLMDDLLTDFDKTPIQGLIMINDKLIDYNLNYRYYELKL